MDSGVPASRTSLLIRGAQVALFCLIGPGCAVPENRAPLLRDVIVWKSVGTWSGRESASTEAFSSDTGALRVRWQATDQSREGAGRLVITLQSAVSGRALTVAADHRGSGSGETVTAETSPMVYAFVESTGVDWSFTVEQGLLGTSAQ